MFGSVTREGSRVPFLLLEAERPVLSEGELKQVGLTREQADAWIASLVNLQATTVARSREARAQKLEPAPGVIILSMHADESYIMRALGAGARGYLVKDATDEDLIPAVRAVAAGKPFFSPTVAAVLMEDYVRQLRARGLSDSYELLTDREREILQLLAEGRSNKEVAALLDVGLSTVETHRANLMQKLNLHNTAEIVLYAVRKGIIVHS